MVVLGDDIAARWPADQVPVDTVMAGRDGDTTADLAARFQRDVLGRGATAVAIIGGTNDLLGPGAYDPGPVLDMVRRAQAAGVCVVLVGFLPADVPGANLFAADAAREGIAASYGTQWAEVLGPMRVQPPPGQPLAPPIQTLAPDMQTGDGVHLSAEGYHRLGVALAEASSGCVP
jgi:lysophospholipase L1-like esterase